MATFESIESTHDLEYYAGLSRSHRAALSYEMAQDVSAHHSRIYAVVSSITDRLKAEGVDGDCITLSLAEVAEEMLLDVDQEARLLNCLHATLIDSKATGMTTKEVAHG